MRVSILIMAFLPPFRAETSASSARVAASLHWASSSFLSFSRFMASSCSQRSSSARRAASTMARAALSSESLASLVISSRSAFSCPSSPSSFLLEAVVDWLTLVRSARVSLVSASSCSAARRWRSAVSRRARASSRPLATAAALRSAVTLASAAADLAADSSSTLTWASRTWRAYFLMVVWVSALPAMACSRARPRSEASPSSFFFILRASALLLVSVSRATCIESRALDWAFLTRMNSSSFSARRRSISCLTALSSSWHLSTLFSSCSRVASASSRADCSSIFSASRRFLILSISWLEHGLLVGRLDLEQLRGGVASLLLADVRVEGKAVNLALPLADHLVELLGLPVHGSVEDLGLVKAAGHLADLRRHLTLGLFNLVQLGVEVVDGRLSLSQTSGELHLGHLELLTLGDGVSLVLLTPALGLTLGLGDQPQGVLATSGLLLESAPGSVKLVLEVPVLAKKKSPLASLVVAQGLDIAKLGRDGGLLLGKDVQVIVKVANDAEKVGVLASNLVLAGGKVSQSKVGVINLLVDGVEALQHLLVGHISRGLGPHHLISGSAGISDLVHDEHLVLLDLGFHLAKSVNLLSHLSSGISLLPLQVGEDGLLLDVGLFHVLAQLVHLRF